VVRIQTEELQRKKFEVVPHVNGKPEDGYAVGNVLVRPEYVYVTGAVSVVGQISSVGVEIDTSGADSDTSGSSRVILYDANGNELDDLGNDITLNRSEVEYQVSILKVKELSLDFQVSGEVAEGYRFTGVESDVRTVSVEGMRSVLASLGTIVVPGELLNIEGATSDVTVEVDLNELLPDNISMAAFSAQTAMIVLKVEPLAEQMVTLKVQKLELVGASQDYEYNFEEDEIAVWIRGLPEDLERLDVGALTGRADVTGMGPGYYSVEVVIDLADGFEILESDLLSVHIEDPNAGPGESEEGETEAETETEETSAQG
jgi:YbbR domain-containing protein